VAAPVVDRFEMIEVEGEHAHRRHARLPIARHEAAGGLKEAAAVQQIPSDGSVAAASL
jgi:hypothetical protein